MNSPASGSPWLTTPLAAYATVAVLLPAPALADDRSLSTVLTIAVALAISAGVATAAARRARRPAFAWLAGPVVVVAGWLLPQLEPSPITWLLALAIGMAVGIGVVPLVLDARIAGPATAGALAGTAQLAILVAVDGAHAAAWCGVSFGAAIVLTGAARVRAPRRRAGPRLRLLATAMAVLTVAVGFWIGANSSTATWFGRQVSHGDRSGTQVAITFDDGPNVLYSLRIARILDDHGATGTFFLVGKALEARPGVARGLMEDGHLLANHSYHHDSWRWLDPRYPELQRTQDVFERKLGVCPAFYRAPHGQHTPLTANVVGDHGMTMIGWDVSAGDWNTTDARLVARRVLDDVEPGSIIVLHDSIDGNVTADRSVLIRALPIILEGLERRGLDAVGLDALLGKKAYGDHC